jgi:hypothetical protein
MAIKIGQIYGFYISVEGADEVNTDSNSSRRT